MNKYITCRQRHINKLIMCCGNVNGIESNDDGERVNEKVKRKYEGKQL